MQNLIQVKKVDPVVLQNFNQPFYTVLLVAGAATFSIDFVTYHIKAKSLVFLTPLQFLEWKNTEITSLNYLQFHGDFYCIEYHKKEVACNGILFNNIYTKPYISISNELFEELMHLFHKINTLALSVESFDVAIVKSYVQLILALSSKEKQLVEAEEQTSVSSISQVGNFKELLEKHFIIEKSVGFYANYYALAVDSFSKKIKKEYGKSPSVLIQERMVLEAKKQLHLTHKNIKEIATDLGFEDAFYFSRYFKNYVGVSPKLFREQVGISIVAK